jgi:type I site-specific restriction endonuclease
VRLLPPGGQLVEAKTLGTTLSIVAEYNRERAVADGVNVGYDVYRIKTRATESGGGGEKGAAVVWR